MADYSKQQKAHQFLLDKFGKDEAFKKPDLQIATGWQKDGSFDTYWSKQFKPLLVPLPDGDYRVGEVFRRFTDWDQFQQHVTQVRRTASEYTVFTHERVILFEFFMPLSNEIYLGTALDSLFYEDTIRGRLKTVGLTRVQKQFPRSDGESETDYLARICHWIAKKFSGYSISHVHGRFRDGDLKSIRQAADILEKKAGRYLIDETTAIVRFIFPCGRPGENTFHDYDDYIEAPLEGDAEETKAEASLIRFFFWILFVRSVVEFVNGEEQIWLLESGMRERLHIWRVKKDDETGYK